MNAVRDYLMKMVGMEANIVGAPTDKQWDIMREWLEELRAAHSQTPTMVANAALDAHIPIPAGKDQEAIPSAAPPANPKPMDPDLAAQLAALKKAGAAGANAANGGLALDAGPPPGARKR